MVSCRSCCGQDLSALATEEKVTSRGGSTYLRHALQVTDRLAMVFQKRRQATFSKRCVSMAESLHYTLEIIIAFVRVWQR